MCEHDDLASRARLWGLVFNRRMLACALLGFSSGMPLYVLIQLLPAWFRTEGLSLATISSFSLLKLPYTWKFLWAPLLDRFSLPRLGRHRGWMLLAQLLLLAVVGAFAFFEPTVSTFAIAVLALLVAIFSATQDIAVDAYRRELLPDAELGLGNSVFVNTYRIAGLIPGGLALPLAERLPWSSVYWIVASFMLVGVIGTFLAPPVSVPVQAPTRLKEAVVGPFVEFFTREDYKAALVLLLFLFFYKLGDNLATTLITPFYIDLGFTLTEIGTVVKVSSLWSTVVGSLVGGVVIAKVGINRSLWVFGVVQMVSILGFALLSELGRSMIALVAAVTFEYLGVGLGTAAFVAFMARATSKHFSATQYALFSSFVALPGVIAGALAGLVIEAIGYTQFFLLCTLLALPGMLLLFKVAPWNHRMDEE